MAGKGPTDQDGAEAVRRLLSGLARGEKVFDLAAAIERSCILVTTRSRERWSCALSADALEVAGAGQDDPVPYTGLREKYLAECKFQGRENRKIQFAILASASARSGIQPGVWGQRISRYDDRPYRWARQYGPAALTALAACR